MAGTKIGGLKAAKKVKERFGADHFRKIGKVGGETGTTGGFYANRELAKVAGAKGGRISKRGPFKVKPDDNRVIVRRFKSGESAISLAREYGITRQRVYKIMESDRIIEETVERVINRARVNE